MKTYKYNNEKERLNIIIENQGKENIEDKQLKTFYYLEEDEKIENRKIIKNKNYINELKEEKIKELDNFLMNLLKDKIKQEYNINLDFRKAITLQDKFLLCRKVNKRLKETFNIIQDYFDLIKTFQDTIEDKINNKKTIKEIKQFDIEKEYENQEKIIINNAML